MEELLLRKNWVRDIKETPEDRANRKKLQLRHITNLRMARGECYMIRFNDGDIRPMWEDQINIKELRESVKTPASTHYDCPLCQPYDQWDGLAEMNRNRRYLCRVVKPTYKNGCVDEIGSYKKCVCILRPQYRKGLKFKA